MVNINIRPAKKTESETIRDFQLLMAMESESLQLNAATVLQGVDAVFDNFSKGKYFIAESGNQVIASLLITYEWSDWRAATVWWIQSVYVLPEYRNKGVFKRMYRFLKEQVEIQNAVAGLRLYVDKTNKNAIEVYKKAGMNREHYELFEWMKNS